MSINKSDLTAFIAYLWDLCESVPTSDYIDDQAQWLTVVKEKLAVEDENIARSHGITLDFELEQAWERYQPAKELELPVFTAASFLGRTPPEREWLINGVLPKVPYTLMFAMGGIGKSYDSLQIASSIATGLPYLDHFTIEDSARGSVLIINKEDDKDDLHRRMYNIADHLKETHGITDDQLIEGLSKVHFLDEEALRRSKVNVPIRLYPYCEEFINAVRAKARSMQDLKLIILDPLNRLMLEDMNDNRQASVVVDLIFDLSRELGVSFLVLTHTNKSSQSATKTGRRSSHDASASLGAASLVNGARHTIFLDYPRDKELGQLPVDRDIVLHHMPKCNYLSQMDRLFWIQKDENGVMSYFDQPAWWAEHSAAMARDDERSLQMRCIEIFTGKETLKKMEFYKAMGLSNKTGAKYLELALDKGFITTDGKVFRLGTHGNSPATDTDED